MLDKLLKFSRKKLKATEKYLKIDENTDKLWLWFVKTWTECNQHIVASETKSSSCTLCVNAEDGYN